MALLSQLFPSSCLMDFPQHHDGFPSRHHVAGRRHLQSKNPKRPACAQRAQVDDTPNLARNLATMRSTVATPRCISAAISRCSSPLPTLVSTARSCASSTRLASRGRRRRSITGASSNRSNPPEVQTRKLDRRMVTRTGWTTSGCSSAHSRYAVVPRHRSRSCSNGSRNSPTTTILLAGAVLRRERTKARSGGERRRRRQGSPRVVVGL